MLSSFIKDKQILHITCDDGQAFPVLKVGKGKPVILLHGFGMEATAWLPFILHLQQDYCFYLPDLRGFGLAGKTNFSQADFFADYANDVRAMREQLKLDHVIIGGISMGAMTCMAMAKLDYMQGVDKMILMDQSPVILNKADWQWGLMGTHQDVFLKKLTQVFEQTAPYTHLPFTSLAKPVQRTMVDAIATMLGASSYRKSMQCYATLLKKMPHLAHKTRDMSNWQQQRHIIGGYLHQDYDFRHATKNMTMPTTVVIAKESQLYHPLGQKRFASMLSNATSVEIPRAGHAIPLDRPFKVAKLLKGFLQNGA